MTKDKYEQFPAVTHIHPYMQNTKTKHQTFYAKVSMQTNFKITAYLR